MSASFYDLLKYAATGQASPSMTYYDRMRASTLMGGVVQTLTGIPPLSFNSNGKPLISWSMLGNGQQTGTPTPDAPIMPTFCGVRTGNLFDASTLENGIYLSSNGNKYGNVTNGVRAGTKIKALPNTAYTLSAQSSGNVSLRIFEWSNGTFTNQTPKYNISGNVSITVTTGADTNEIAFNIEGKNGQYATNIMLNLGSTALPYEPYGWAEKITCAGQTVPVYLGQVQTVRRIKKLVLTGDELWQKSSSYKGSFYVQLISNYLSQSYAAYCTHAVHVPTLSQYSKGKMVFNGGVTANCNLWFEQFDENTTVDAFKTYLAQQYAAGTPVTVWYVLKTPETGITNEPLCKIGDYADELHSADAGVTIPTAKGQNTLTVETDLQPSEMTIRYKA